VPLAVGRGEDLPPAAELALAEDFAEFLIVGQEFDSQFGLDLGPGAELRPIDVTT
jgi:hypothetical protein